jgi:hypothetical protein
MALRVTVFFNGQATPIEAGLKAYCQMNHDYGDKLPIKVLRNGQELRLILELPDKPAKVVLATPPSTWQRIAFDPPLPAMLVPHMARHCPRHGNK